MESVMMTSLPLIQNPRVKTLKFMDALPLPEVLYHMVYIYRECPCTTSLSEAMFVIYQLYSFLPSACKHAKYFL